MDIRELIEKSNYSNYKKLAENFMREEREKIDINGNKFSTNYLLRNITRYRKEIKNSMDLDDELKLNLLEIIKGLPEEKKAKDDLFTKNRSEKLLNCTFFNPDKLIEIAIENLNSKHYSYQLASLCLLTGRRPNELILNGKFFHSNEKLSEVCKKSEKYLTDLGYEILCMNSPTDIEKIMRDFHSNNDDSDKKSFSYLLFCGQSKQRKDSKDNRQQPYPIPLLAKDSDILKAIESVRKKIELPEVSSENLYDLNDLIHNKYNKSINNAIKRLFSDYLPKSALSASELRAIYAVSCYSLFHNNNSSVNELFYYSQILGHQDKSIGASFSYANYKVDNSL